MSRLKVLGVTVVPYYDGEGDCHCTITIAGTEGQDQELVVGQHGVELVFAPSESGGHLLVVVEARGADAVGG